MAREVVRCPRCKATQQIDDKKTFLKCTACGNKSLLSSCQVVVPPTKKDVVKGRGLKNHIFLGYFTIFLGTFNIDLLYYKRWKKGLLYMLLIPFGAATVMGIFRGFRALSLEDDDLEEYYKKSY